MKFFKTRELTLAAASILFICIYLGESKSFGQRYSSTSRRIPPRLCGSRLVDVLNVMCSAGVYEPKKCWLAKMYICKTRPYIPICRFDCGHRGRKRRSAEPGSDEMAVFAEKISLLEKSRPARNASSKPKRHIYSQCCAGECSLSDLRNYCIHG